AWIDLARDGPALAVADLHLFFGRHDDTEDLVFDIHCTDARLEVLFHLVLVARVGVDRVPVTSGDLFLGLLFEIMHGGVRRSSGLLLMLLQVHRCCVSRLLASISRHAWLLTVIGRLRPGAIICGTWPVRSAGA